MASLTQTTDTLPTLADRPKRRTRRIVVGISLIGLVVIAGIVLVVTMGFTCG